MNLIEQLVALRTAVGSPQEQVAQASGLPLETIAAIEAGSLDAPLSVLEAYGRALGVEFITTPPAFQSELEAYFKAGGKWPGQPARVNAPRSIVDELLDREGPPNELPDVQQ